MSDDWNIQGVPPGQKPARAKPQTVNRGKNRKSTLKEKRARFLLNTLKEEHNFDLIAEIVKTYHEIEDLEDDHERLRLMRSVQKDLMKYCFPTLKSTETHKETEQTVINFNIPALPSQAKKVSPDYLDEPLDIQDGEIIDGD